MIYIDILVSGLPYAEKTADYYADDYNYSSDDDYLNGDGLDGGDGFLGHGEEVIHATPQITSVPTDQLINEGDTIKLPCLVDKPRKVLFYIYSMLHFIN